MLILTVTVALLAIASASAIAVASTVGSHHDIMIGAATVAPFAPGVADPSSDTLQNDEAMIRTVLAPAHDWQVATFVSLSQVEDLLDSLEAHGVRGGEVIALTDHCFAVRWK